MTGWQPPQYDPAAHQQRIGTGPEQPGYPYPPAGYAQPPQQQPRRKSWPRRHKILTGLAAAAGIIVIASVAAAAGGGGNAPASHASGSSSAVARADDAAASKDCSEAGGTWVSGACSFQPTAPPPSSPAAPAMTAGQQQAVESAQNYLSDGQGFSSAGLLNQLTSSYGEGFSRADAEFAISYLHPDWDQQAVESAKNYMSDGEGFSRSELLQQLESSYGEGFTVAQATYAVNQVMGS